MISLRFDPDKFEKGQIEFKGETIKYLIYRNVPYVSRPEAPDVQVMNVYVREDQAGRHDMPIYFFQRTGGMEGTDPFTIEEEAELALKRPDYQVRVYGKEEAVHTLGHDAIERESIFGHALKEGFVAVAPGIRGRDTVVDGVFVGRGELPMSIIDIKAVVRYIHYNADVFPGDHERIIEDGASSGGGMSALLGVSGNSALYEPFLEAAGAAPGRDDIYCAIVNSPITDLAHIDIAYEWMFSVDNVEGLFAGDSVSHAMSKACAAEFEKYVDELGLKDPETGERVGFAGGDTYTPYFIRQINESATRFLSSLSDEERHQWLENPANRGVVTWDGQSAEITGLKAYIGWNSGRWMKYIGDYDGFTDKPSRENEAFGTRDGSLNGHFSPIMGEVVSGFEGFEDAGKEWKEDALKHARGEYLINPLTFLRGFEKGDMAPVWYMRCGAHHETTLNLFQNLTLLIKADERVKAVDARYSWTQRHTSISQNEPDECYEFLKKNM